jgi:hypothetical protein
MSDAVLTEPWRSFLHDVDELVQGPTELHCLGGFVIAQLYDFERVTADVDVIVVRGEAPATLAARAGPDSELYKRHKVYLDIVTAARWPENYETRLLALVPGTFTHLRLKALEKHDLVLAKLTRNIDRDREDVKRLARSVGLDPALLRERYQTELRWQLSRPEREDTTIDLWVEMIAEVSAGQSRPAAARHFPPSRASESSQLLGSAIPQVQVPAALEDHHHAGLFERAGTQFQ